MIRDDGRTDLSPAASSSPLALDPTDAGFRDDPYGPLARLREVEPVHESPLGFWLLTRFDDVKLALKDPRFAKSWSTLDLAGLESGPLRRLERTWMLTLDPPAHTRIRTLVTKAFTPRAVEGMRPWIAARVERLLDEVAGARTVDVVADLAFPLPMSVIGEMLGLPDRDHHRLRAWARELVGAFDPIASPEAIDAASRAVEDFYAWAEGWIDERRRRPGTDLLSTLIAAEERGDRLSLEELQANVLLLTFAGFETTVNLIANAVLCLARNPDALAAVRADERFVRGAVEETLRFEPPVSFTQRRTATDVTLGTRTIPAGSDVMLAIGAANRDPTRFADPDRYDVRRAEGEALSFGHGIHYCIGAALGRLEAEVAIGALLRRLPELTLADPPPAWSPRLTIRSLEALIVKGESR